MAITHITANADPSTVDVDSTTKGLLVLITQPLSATDGVSAVSVGSTSLSRVRSDADTSGEPGRSWLYFAGTGIDTGSGKSVSITGGAGLFVVVAQIKGAGVDMEVIDHDGVGEDGDGASFVLSYAGRDAMSYGIFYSGKPDLTDIVPNANMTELASIDHGAIISRSHRQTTSGTSDFTMSWTSPFGSDDRAVSVCAIADVEGAEPQVILPDADIVTTGWSTAPLWSKVGAIDGTTITSTAS